MRVNMRRGVRKGYGILSQKIDRYVGTEKKTTHIMAKERTPLLMVQNMKAFGEVAEFLYEHSQLKRMRSFAKRLDLRQYPEYDNCVQNQRRKISEKVFNINIGFLFESLIIDQASAKLKICSEDQASGFAETTDWDNFKYGSAQYENYFSELSKITKKEIPHYYELDLSYCISLGMV